MNPVRLPEKYNKYLPSIGTRILIILCKKCITQIETDYLKSTPYESLPLLINDTWYGTDTKQLYKNLLSKTETINDHTK